MIDLTKFCGTGSSRYNLDKPWEADGKLVATDGRICVECDRELYGGELAEPDATVPKYLCIFEPHYGKVKKWQKLPDYGTCENDCKVKCDVCKGTGDHYCDVCQKFHTCGKCDGTGHAPCRCGVMFGKKKIARELANKIAGLPEVTWGTLKDENYPVFFRFQGGRGVVMPFVEE